MTSGFSVDPAAAIAAVGSRVTLDLGAIEARDAEHELAHLLDAAGIDRWGRHPAGWRLRACTYFIDPHEIGPQEIAPHELAGGAELASARRAAHAVRHSAVSLQVLGGAPAGALDDLVARAVTAGALVRPPHRSTSDSEPEPELGLDSELGGRAFLFAGIEHAVGVLPLGELLARTEIAASYVVGGVAGLDTLVTTRDFVRPRFRDGVLTIELWPAVGDTLVPFEVPNPTPCCAVHG